MCFYENDKDFFLIKYLIYYDNYIFKLNENNFTTFKLHGVSSSITVTISNWILSFYIFLSLICYFNITVLLEWIVKILIVFNF